MRLLDVHVLHSMRLQGGQGFEAAHFFGFGFRLVEVRLSVPRQDL